MATREPRADRDGMQDNLRPGVISRDGFLGNDTRDLAEILKDDDIEVKRLGLEHGRIARRMREVRDAGIKGLGDAIRMSPDLEVTVDSARGKLPCPFRDEGLFLKTNTTVRKVATGKEISYSDLNIHMIEAHGFYEGRGGPFRLEPAVLAEVLGLMSSQTGRARGKKSGTRNV